MNRNFRPRFSPELSRPVVKTHRRFYEGGGTIPQPGDKSEILNRFRERFRSQDVIRQVSVPERFTTKELGHIATPENPDLPVLAYKEAIIASVAENQVTIITAETGAGKSTQVPQYLLEHGYHINMTQPRRISASFVAEQIDRELKEVLGEDAAHLAGFHTAEQNSTVPGITRVTALTDGLRLVQEFGQRDELEHEVLIIDEVHEWNSNIEMLIGQVKRLLQEKPDLRVVIMSATMEAERLAEYFSNQKETHVPIIEIPGRNHEVTRLEEAESTVEKQVLAYAKTGQNMLVFLPGVREIEDLLDSLKKKLSSEAVILPLHSKLSQTEQDAVKASYSGIKIILATNIAQTSITIPDVDVVIDSGLERRREIDDEGVQSLNLRYISRADMHQRAGRTGRVRPGTYIHTRLYDQLDFVPFDSADRSDYPVPEILRTDVDRNMLFAASAGIDFAQLELFHPVSSTVIKRSKEALRIIGALDDSGTIAPKGLRMTKFPMRPMYARMLIEAEDRGLSLERRTQAIAMVSAMEVGGMPSWLKKRSREWRNLTEQTDSDHIAQLDLFAAGREMEYRDLHMAGFDVKNYERATELYTKVRKRMSIPATTELVPPNTSDVKELRYTIAAGLADFVYQRRGVSEYVRVEGKTGTLRTKTERSTVYGHPKLVVATPYGIERFRSGSRETEHVIQDLSEVTPQLLGEVATTLLSWSDEGELKWSNGRLVEVRKQLFRHAIETGVLREEDAQPNRQSIAEVTNYILTHSGSAVTQLKAIKKELEQLQHLTVETLPKVSDEDLRAVIDRAIEGSVLDPSYVDHRVRIIMNEEGLELDALVSSRKRNTIRRNAPETMSFEGLDRKITYRRGIPRFKINDIRDTLRWSGNPLLDDGRVVKVVFNGRLYEAQELQALARSE